MGRTKLVALAAALAMLPGIALAQASAPTAPTVASTNAPSVAPAVSAEKANAEAATAVVPTDPTQPTSATANDGATATPGGGAEPELKGSPEFGQPVGGWHLQGAVTELGREAHWFNAMLLWIMGAVTILVIALLGYSIVKFRAKANPIPSRTSHNTLIEVIWTAVPVLILVIIAVPSFRLLAEQYDPPRADLTVKAIGHQWYWEYQYPDLGELGYDSLILSDADAAKRGDPRLLGVDNRLVVPAGAVVKVLTTSTDVIHAFAIPAFWVKMDAVPGRINETWFKVDRPGVYYGQCSELCGTKHAFMPIAVEVLPPAQFRAWLAAKLADGKIDRTPEIEAAITDATNGSAPRPVVAAPAAAAATPAAANDNAAPAAAGIPAEGAVASQNSTSTAPAATK